MQKYITRHKKLYISNSYAPSKNSNCYIKIGYLNKGKQLQKFVYVLFYLKKKTISSHKPNKPDLVNQSDQQRKI